MGDFRYESHDFSVRIQRGTSHPRGWLFSAFFASISVYPFVTHHFLLVVCHFLVLASNRQSIMCCLNVSLPVGSA